MENKTKTKTERILMVMRILAWVAFVGLSIKTGSMIISYGVSCVNHLAARNLYNGMDLYNLREFSFWLYTLSVSFIVAFSAIKANVAYLIIKTLSKVNLMNPFKIEMARILEKISYFLVGASSIGLLNNAQAAWVMKRADVFQPELNSGELIFMAGIVFIISQVFKRGVEIQSKNELTV